jgi:hypothetical protein
MTTPGVGPASGGEPYFELDGMTAMARTPVLPEAVPVGALSAPLRHPGSGHPPLPFDDSGLTFDPRRAREDFAQVRRHRRGRAGRRIDPTTASTSSLKRTSPLVHRATNEPMTYCARMRWPSRSIASTCRLKATTSASTPTSSRSSRATANAANGSQSVTAA